MAHNYSKIHLLGNSQAPQGHGYHSNEPIPSSNDTKPTFQFEVSGPTGPNEGFGNPWRSGFFRRLPWRGICAWLLAVACTCTAVAVLKYSDGTLVSNWTVQPTVWVSLTSTITGSLLTYAFMQAAAMAFWRAASQPTTLQNLHDMYTSTSGVASAVLNVVRARAFVASLASIIITLSAARGPLMQRASSTTNRYLETNGSLTFHISQILPAGYGAIYTGRTNTVNILTQSFTKIAQAYTNREGMTVSDTYCENCTTSVQGFGFDVNCTESTVDFDIDVDEDRDSALNGAYLFYSNTTDETGNSVVDKGEWGGWLRINTVWKETSNCQGTLNTRTCDLHAGVTKYNVTLDGSTATLVGTWRSDVFINRTQMNFATGTDNIIGGFNIILDALYGSYAYMNFDATGGNGYNLVPHGLTAAEYYNMNGTDPACEDTWSDPMNDIIETARELAFRASLQYASETPTDTEDVQYTSITFDLIYVTDYSKLWVAVAVSFIGLVSALPVFWGWWQLGRKVSLSPLEVANAFGAFGPTSAIPSHIDPIAGTDEIVKHSKDVGDIRYGAYMRPNGSVGLGFGAARAVRPPKDGETFHM